MNAPALTYALALPFISFGLVLSGHSRAQQTVIEERYAMAAVNPNKPWPPPEALLTQAGTPFSSKEGRFSIILPSGFPAFKYQKQTTPTAVGDIVLNSYNSETPRGACAVMYSDFPAATFEGRSAQKILEDGRDAALKAVNGTLEKEKSTTVQGFPALTIYWSTSNQGKSFYSRFDFVLVQPRAYQIGYISYDKNDLDKPDIQTYFKSFRLDD